VTIPTHLIAGLLIGKLTGNYPLAIASSALVDVDHLQSYIKSGVILKPKLFWKTITDQADPYGNQRGYLHNTFVFFIISSLLYLFFSVAIVPFILGWLGHLILDALDNSDYWPLYPNKRVNLKGPILYATYQELLFAIFLLSLYFVL
jgi:membrane-bound metal-dependent hydrolase YbcI (DUF457 family)